MGLMMLMVIMVVEIMLIGESIRRWLLVHDTGYIGTSGFGSGNINNASNSFKNPFAVLLLVGQGFSSTCLSEEFFRAGTVKS